MADEKISVSRERFGQFITEANDLARYAPQEQGDDQLVVDYGHLKHVAALAVGFINPRQPLGTELFSAVCPLSVGIAIEAVCLRRGDMGGIEVLLTQRALTETAGPGEWHCPGSVQRPGEAHDDVFARLAEREFGAAIRSRVFVADVFNPDPRGQLESKVHLCEVAEGGLGTWFPITALPQTTNEVHRHHIIPIAVDAFRKKEREALVRNAACRVYRALVESARGTASFFSTDEQFEIIGHVLRQLR